MRSFTPFLLLFHATGMARSGPASWDPTVPPEPVVFSTEEKAAILAGAVVYKVVNRDDHHAIGISAAMTRAPTNAVWEEILDFDAYVEYLPYITASSTVSRVPFPGGERIVSRLQLTTMGVVTTYEMENVWFPEKGFLNWFLTPRTLNPLNYVRGSWQILPLEDTPGCSLMIYRAEVDMRWWVPDFLQTRAADRGLPVLVGLVRKRAEAHVG